MATHLSSGRLNLSLLRGTARNDLIDLLERRPGNKALIWDPTLAGLYGLVAEFSLLQRSGVVRMFNIQPGASIPQSSASQNLQHVIFFVRPNLQLMESVADMIKRDSASKDSKTGSGSGREYHLIFVPRRNFMCERRLQELGVFGDFTTVDDHKLHLVPLDNDILSLELPLLFKEVNVENDLTGLFHVAKSIMQLQAIYGLIPNISGQGRSAKHVHDMILKMRSELASTAPEAFQKQQQIEPQIDTLILIDRAVDLISPSLTPFTYEALIDEVIGIQNGSIKLTGKAQRDTSPESTSEPQPKSRDNKSHPLNSADEFYGQSLRDKHIHAVAPTLNARIKALKEKEDAIKTAGSTKEMSEFVKKLPEHQAANRSVALHTSLAETIMESIRGEPMQSRIFYEQDLLQSVDQDKISPYIEDCIGREEPLERVLRLITIQSQVSNGLKPKVWDHYKREVVQTYGFTHVLTLSNLERVGLVKIHPGYRHFTVLAKKLRLLVDAYDAQEPRDMNYIYRGYAPLSIRLAQFLSSPNWRSSEELLSLLPAPTIDSTQPLPPGLHPRPEANGEVKKVVLVYLIGGCTFAELTALRYLSKLDILKSDFILATTKLVNGRTFMEPLIETVKLQ